MELFEGDFFLCFLVYCIGYLFYCITMTFVLSQVPQLVLLRKVSVLTTCLHNACLAVKARYWNFNKNDHRAVSSSSVL